MAGISDRVLARRQKDLEGFTELYQERLDKMVGQRATELAPAWEKMANSLTKKLEKLYEVVYDSEDAKQIKQVYKEIENMEALKAQLEKDLQLNKDIVEQAEKSQPYFTGAITGAFEDSYYFNAFGLEQGARVGVSVPLLTKASVLGVTANPWLPDGANYSSRIRANAAYIAAKARDTVAQAVANGWSINKAARAMRDLTGEGYFRNVALMRTELNRAASLGSSYLFMENADILDGKRWNATLDTKTAPKDAANDGEIFDLDYDTTEKPGVPGKRIPNHTNCRCKYSPVLSALGVSTKERIAREGGGPDSFGTRTYTKARTYREYAKERGLPDLDERLEKDNLKSYLRPDETLADLNKKVVRWANTGGIIHVPKPYWEEVKAVEVAQPSKLPEFVEAKSLEEAQAYAEQYFSSSKVSYKGLDLQVANEVNRTLHENGVGDVIPKFKGITAKSDKGDHYAATSLMTNDLKINSRTMGSYKKLATMRSKADEAYNLLRDNLDNIPPGPKKDRIIELLSQDRQLVGTDVKSLITHEIGHHLDFSVINKGHKELRRELFDRMKDYTSGISGYAGANGSEYIAESFVAYRLGAKEILDPKLVKLFDDLLGAYAYKDEVKDAAKTVISTWADAVKGRIAKGVKSETDVREVGAIFRKQLEDYEKELRTLKESIEKERHDIMDQLNDLDPSEYEGKKYLDLKKKLADKYNDIVAVEKKLYAERAEKLRDHLKEVRPVGPKNAKDLQPFITGSSAEAKKAIEEVRAYLPSDWLDASNKRPIKAKKVKRGYYSQAKYKDDEALKRSGYTLADLKRSKRLDLVEDHMALSGSGDGMLRCAFHEFSHRLEDVIPRIRELEHEFYGRRTAGEALRWLGPGYSAKEKTRFDNFVNKYMGKDYGNKADSYYEILSMGIESVYRGSNDLSTDTDYLDFIYGILASI